MIKRNVMRVLIYFLQEIIYDVEACGSIHIKTVNNFNELWWIY